jgi:hypothetical protein
MADNAPRAALAEQSRSDLAALVADAWSDRGWTVARGDPAGADVVATREEAYAERLAIVVADPGATVDVATVQRAAAIREQERADVVLVVGTDDVDDGATDLARREALNVKVLDGWSLCRVLDEQGLLGRVGAGGGGTSDDGGNADASGTNTGANATDASGATGDTATPTGSGATAAGSTESTVTETDPTATGAGSSATGAESTTADGDEETGTASAADNETPCPSCGEPIFRPLIEQGLQCPYCDTDFE